MSQNPQRTRLRGFVLFSLPLFLLTSGILRAQSHTAGSQPSELLTLGEHVLFQADDGEHGAELWISDGSESGTRLLWEGAPGSWAASPAPAIVFGGEAYFCGCTSFSFRQPNCPLESFGLWKTDGTAEGTQRLAAVNPICASTDTFAVLGDHLYFTADDGKTGMELWRTDGTPEGTRQVADLEKGPGSSRPIQLFAHGAHLYFSARIGEVSHLFSSDGTTEGTRSLAPLKGGYSGWHFAFASLGNHLYFTADDGKTGGELWRTDGTTEGTHLVLDIQPGPKGSQIFSLTELNGRLYFSASDGKDRELWGTDGTAAGTASLNVNPAKGSYPDHLARFGKHLYFSATGDDKGSELWRTDGTAKGTERVTDIYRGKDGSDPNLPVAMEDFLFFVAESQKNGMELWRTDGTKTQEVLDVQPGPGSGRPRYLVRVGDRLFFNADDGKHGMELWVSDGTAAGTHQVMDIHRGPGS